MAVSAEHQPSHHQTLTSRLIPHIHPEQLKLFNYDNLKLRKIEQGFNARLLERLLFLNSGQTLLGVSIDTDQITAIPFQIQNSQLKVDEERITSTSSNETGKDYVPFLEAVALCARKDNIPVGIATIGNIRRSQLVASADLPEFKKELTRICDADFALLFPTLYAVSSHEQASLKTVALQTEKMQKSPRGILFITNGNHTFRGGVIKDSMLFSMEPGNVPFFETKRHGSYYDNVDPDETIVQYVVTGRGINEQLRERKATSTPTTNHIQEQLREFEFATDLYDQSALMTATAIEGMARSVWLMQGENDTIIALDGDMFANPDYGQRVMQILRYNLGFDPQFFFTSQHSPHIAAEGAAISALVSQCIQRWKANKLTHS